MKRQVLGLVLITAIMVGVATHAILLFGSPIWATDRQISEAIKRGATWNKLKHNAVPKAGTTAVPLANPDSFTSRAFIDLSNGPFLLEGPVPKSCVYWSASVFAHNTDTVLILSDKDFADGDVRIGIARRKNDIAQSVDAIALPPSNKAVLLLRCFMRNSNDASYMATLDLERQQLVLRPLSQERRP